MQLALDGLYLRHYILLYCVDFILQILSYKFNNSDSIMQILLYRFYYTYFIMQILSCLFHHPPPILLHCAHYIVELGHKIALCRLHYVYFIICISLNFIVSCRFHYANSSYTANISVNICHLSPDYPGGVNYPPTTPERVVRI